MDGEFSFDVFLSHSAKDKIVVRGIAKRLREDGLTVWFDEWVLKTGDNIPSKIEEGLERSRVLVLCMSANAFGSDWAQLEAGTFRFRDPLNKERRFIPVRLDDAPIKGSLAQLLYVDWQPPDREQDYLKLLEACRPPAKPRAEAFSAVEQLTSRALNLKGKPSFLQYEFSATGERVLTCTDDPVLRLWDTQTGACLREIKEYGGARVTCVSSSKDERRALSGGYDGTLRLWDIETGRCLRVVGGHVALIAKLAWSADERRALTCSYDLTLRLWEIDTGTFRVLVGHKDYVWCVAWSGNERYAISGGQDHTLRIWEIEGDCAARVLEGHKGAVLSVTSSSDGRHILSGSADKTVRLWELETGRCLRVLEGHTDVVTSVAWVGGEPYALSCSRDRTLRIWDSKTGRCVRVLQHDSGVRTVASSPDGRYIFSGDFDGGIRIWDLATILTKARAHKETSASWAPDQLQYTNAKVLLVGESGAGKTGLSKRLALDDWEPSDSTVGAWATQWKLPLGSDEGVEREIWLWDFGGQADQRLIHQLYMDETALAVLVFDGQKEDVLETLGQWDRDLTRASRNRFAKLLVAGRVDAGGLRVSRRQIETFAAEHRFLRFLETSAKKNVGCEELKQAILAGINWDEIPCRTTEVIFKRLKEEIIRLKDAGRALMRFNELRETLQLRLAGESKRFTDQELRAALTLLTGPGVIWELKFGSWVLLQPERINAYAQAVIRTLQSDEHQRGYVLEEQVLKANLAYESSMARLEGDDERFVLLAMHQALVERGLCLRQPTSKGNLLIFPSYYRRERPEQVKFPAVLVSYRFTGFLDEIYATLVVRLHHTEPFRQDQLWRYAADFKTNTDKQLGVKLTRKAPGVGELEVYFDPVIAIEEKIIFSKYVHEHLLHYAQDVERLRHYICANCGTPVGNRELAMKRLNDWLASLPPSGLRRIWKADPTIICVGCEKRVPLWDDMEQCFASPEIQQRVRHLQEESNIVLDNESRERALVGEVISTVALAGQICREKNVSDHGIDMEIEFKDDANEATGQMVLLHLKTGASYEYDGRIVIIEEVENVRYWMAQQFPVLIVVRTAEGEVRWTEAPDRFNRVGAKRKTPVREIFQGERFDVMSVRRWRKRALGQSVS
jgi:small GTP-binding protein